MWSMSPHRAKPYQTGPPKRAQHWEMCVMKQQRESPP